MSSRSVRGRPKEARLKLMHEGGLYSWSTGGQDAWHENREAHQLAVTPRVASIHVPNNKRQIKIKYKIMVNRHLSDFNKIMFHTIVIIMNKNKNKKDNQLTVSHLGGRRRPGRSGNEIRRPLLTQAVKGGAEGLLLWDDMRLGTPSCVKLLSAIVSPAGISISETAGGRRRQFLPGWLGEARRFSIGVSSANTSFGETTGERKRRVPPIGWGSAQKLSPVVSPAGTDWS